MKEKFLELIGRIGEIESRFHTDTPPEGCCIPTLKEIYNDSDFLIWIQELRCEVQAIVDVTGDAYAKDTLSALSQNFNGWNDEKMFNDIKGRLFAMKNNIDKYYNPGHSVSVEKKPKIFISHSSHDKEYVEKFVILLDDMGLDSSQIFCSSLPGYDIPLDKDIFDSLSSQFQDFNLHVFIIHSKNYYSSPISLNEMGAAWVLKTHCTSILLPGFEFEDMKGVVNSNTISIKLDRDESEVKDKLNQLYTMLIDEFGLTRKKDILWENKRNTFIDSIQKSASKPEKKIDTQKTVLSDEAIKMLLEANSDGSGTIIKLATLSGTSFQAGQTAMNADNTQRETARWTAVLDELKALGYIKQTDKKGELYQITELGYRYIESNNNSEK